MDEHKDTDADADIDADAVAPFRNIVVIGAGSPLGRAIVKELAPIPDVQVTVLSRPSSTLPPLPASVRVERGDQSSEEFLAQAFEGQDMVVSCIGPAAIPSQRRLITAAAAAGVRRFLPSEWAGDTADPALIEAVGFYKSKVEIVKHLRATAEQHQHQHHSKKGRGRCFEWTAIASGLWWDVCLSTGEMGLGLTTRSAVLYDGGDRPLGGTSTANLARAVRALVERPELGRNEMLYVQGLRATQRELLAALKKASGDGRAWSVSEASGQERRRRGLERVEAGDLEGAVDVIWGTAYSMGLGVEFGPDRKVSNDLLMVRDESVEDVAREALAKALAKA